MFHDPPAAAFRPPNSIGPFRRSFRSKSKGGGGYGVRVALIVRNLRVPSWATLKILRVHPLGTPV